MFFIYVLYLFFWDFYVLYLFFWVFMSYTYGFRVIYVLYLSRATPLIKSRAFLGYGGEMGQVNLNWLVGYWVGIYMLNWDLVSFNPV